MSKQGGRYAGARSAPSVPSAHSPDRRPIIGAIRLCAAFWLLAAGCPALAHDETVPDVPVAEHMPDSPPTGIRLGSGVTFSGYGTLQLLAPDHRTQGQSDDLRGDQDGPDDNAQFSRRARLDLSHLSGIVWWEPSPAWKVLGELDFQDVVQVPHHGDDDGPDSAPFVALDRLYVDYHVTDSVSMRAGKFLTPIGRWNQEHSDPLVWTVLRPLISQSAFPTSATGLMVLGSVPLSEQWIDYQVYAADGADLRPSPRSQAFDRALGARVSTSLDRDLQLGVSFSRFDESDYTSDRFTLVGLDAAWSWRHSEFSGEAILRRGSNRGNERGWFGQAVVPVGERWWAVARVEAYHRAAEESRSRTGLVGFVYKSGQHWVFKAELARAWGDAQGLPSGLLSSVTLIY